MRSWGLRKREGERVERVEGDLKGEGGEGGEGWGFSVLLADRSSSFSQPTALVLRFSYGQYWSVSWMKARRVSLDGWDWRIFVVRRWALKRRGADGVLAERRESRCNEVVNLGSSSGRVSLDLSKMKSPRNITASARLAFSDPIPFMDSSPIKFSRIAAYSGKIFIGGIADLTSNSEEAAAKAESNRNDPVRDSCTSEAEEGKSPFVAAYSTSGFVTTDNSSSGVIVRSRARAYQRSIFFLGVNMVLD